MVEDAVTKTGVPSVIEIPHDEYLDMKVKIDVYKAGIDELTDEVSFYRTRYEYLTKKLIEILKITGEENVNE